LFWLVLGSIMVPQTALAIPTYLMYEDPALAPARVWRARLTRRRS
jgi:ABC-type glycerol-3-phosphate transport system permease component